MSYVLSQKNLLSEDLKNFITSVTGYEDGSPKFTAVENNAWSTIFHYNCPSLDKKAIRSRVYGFVEKFRIHAYSFPQKAKNMEMLFERYIELNAYEDEVKWNLLQLLLLLSRRPTEARDDDPPVRFPLVSPEPWPDEPPFDWATYLKEGLQEYRIPSSDSDNQSDCDEDLRNTKEAIYQASREILKQRRSISGANLTDVPSYPFSKTEIISPPFNSDFTSNITKISAVTDTKLLEDDTMKERGKEELKGCLQAWEAHKRLHPIWWSDPCLREMPPSKMSIPNALFIWEKNMSVKGVTLDTTRVLSEAKVMKEILWILSFPGNYTIVERSPEGQYRPRESVSISSTNPVDFFNNLSEVCPYLTIIEKLNSFVKGIEKMPVGIDKRVRVPCTLIAYAGALKHLMNVFRITLSTFEAFINKQEDICMLSYLLLELRPWLHHLKSIYSVHCKAVPEDWRDHENWIVASRLLVVLYNSLDFASGWEKVDLTRIFLMSLEPYIDILEMWLTRSKCTDFQDEFLIRRASTDGCKGKLSVRDYKYQLMFYNIHNTQFLDNFVYYSVRACSSNDFKILLSQSFKQDLNLQSAFEDSDIRKVDCFYIAFLKSLVCDLEEEGVACKSRFVPNLKLLKDKYGSLIKHPSESESQGGAKGSLKNLSYVLYDWNKYCPDIANSGSTQMFKFITRPSSDCLTSDQAKELFSRLEKVDTDSTDVAGVIKKNFNLVIIDRMQPQGFARDPLLNDHKLLDHLAVLKSVYLFLGGVGICILMKTLFNKVLSNGLNSISWANELRELLYNDHPVFGAKFAINLPHRMLHFKNAIFNSKTTYPDFIDFSRHISIDYQVVPPMNLVITSESLDKYNELFTLLLQTKWALSCLSNLSFKDLTTGSKSNLGARLISLRMYMLHNVGTLEKYFIAINSEDFDAEIIQVCSVARDVQVIANALEKILNQKRKYCFLQGPPKILDCVTSLFKQCQSLMPLWKLSVQDFLIIGESEFTAIESVYQDCMNELAGALLQLGKDRHFKNNVNFNFLCDEIFNNMPGDWECQ